MPSNKIVAQGERFNLNISINPLATAITGIQLNIEFNKSMLNVNSIIEGNLFKQNGANTFFNNGTINNSVGTVINIYNAILGPFNVSTPEVFIIINATALGSSGISSINLSNVKIADSNGNSIILNVMNGSVIFDAVATQKVMYINGTVMDNITKAGIAGVIVSTNTSISTSTNATGFYSLAVTESTYALSARLDPTYYTNSTSIVGSEMEEMHDIELVKKPTGNISGSVMQ